MYAEHSKYLTAPISLAKAVPWEGEMGERLTSRSLLRVPGSSRRSALVPIRRIGTLGQWWRTSGHHFALGEEKN